MVPPIPVSPRPLPTGYRYRTPLRNLAAKKEVGLLPAKSNQTARGRTRFGASSLFRPRGESAQFACCKHSSLRLPRNDLERLALRSPESESESTPSAVSANALNLGPASKNLQPPPSSSNIRGPLFRFLALDLYALLLRHGKPCRMLIRLTSEKSIAAASCPRASPISKPATKRIALLL